LCDTYVMFLSLCHCASRDFVKCLGGIRGRCLVESYGSGNKVMDRNSAQGNGPYIKESIDVL
jgi:hypothetical protein